MKEKQGERLSHKVARGTLWVAGSCTLSNILYFLRTILLVRLLNPIDFGLMAIVRVVVNMLNLFSEAGIDKAIVQKKELNETTLNTAWTMMAVRGGILFVLLFLFSPLLSRFYNNPYLSPLLKVISISFVFSGLTSAGVFLFIKELNFKHKVFFEQANAISTTIVSVSLAIIFKNVWALVIGHVIGTIVGCIVSYTLHPFRPSLRFNIGALKGLVHFGKYIFGSGIVIFLFIQGPNVLLGKMVGLHALGFYVLAFNIANMPTTSVTHLVSQIVFPAYAKLQDDAPKLREGYLKVTRLVAFLSAPIAGGIFMLIPEFVQIFLGMRWMPIVVPVRILCILGFFRSIYSTVSPVFYGVGRPDLEFKFACLNLALLAILFYPLTVSRGIAGTAFAFALVSVVSVFFMMMVNYKLIKLNIERVQFFKILFFPLLGTAFMCCSIFLIKRLFSFSILSIFLVSIVVAGTVYSAILYLLDRYCGYGLIDTIKFAVISYKSR